MITHRLSMRVDAIRSKWIRLAFVVVSVAAIAGCSSVASCENPNAEYRAARDNSALRLPSGMAEPDRSAALAIPNVTNTPAAARRDGCLEAPPSYFGSAGRTARTVEEVVASWAQSWADRDADAVVALYSESFAAPAGAGRGPWLSERREQIVTGPVPDSRVENMQVRNEDENRRVVTFVHRFGNNALRKELTLVRESGSWRIVNERVLDVQ